MFGGAGGCIETRAALLAKQGYAALALAFIRYRDLPFKNSFDVPISYFDKVIDWFINYPKGNFITNINKVQGSAMLTQFSERQFIMRLLFVVFDVREARSRWNNQQFTV